MQPSPWTPCNLYSVGTLLPVIGIQYSEHHHADPGTQDVDFQEHSALELFDVSTRFPGLEILPVSWAMHVLKALYSWVRVGGSLKAACKHCHCQISSSGSVVFTHPPPPPPKSAFHMTPACLLHFTGIFTVPAPGQISCYDLVSILCNVDEPGKPAAAKGRGFLANNIKIRMMT